MNIRLQGGRDGIEAADYIRSKFRLPVIFLTAHADSATVLRAKQVSPYGYLLKPFTEHELAATLEISLQRHAIERQLLEKTALLEAVLSSMQDAVIAADVNGNVLVSNEAGRALLVLESEPKSPANVFQHYGLFLPDGVSQCPKEEVPMQRAMAGETVRGAELLVKTPRFPDGRWHSINARPLLAADGSSRGGVTVGRDVTEIKAMQAELQVQSDTDALSGAYNRRGFSSSAKRELQHATQQGERSALFFLDLNGMKTINDTLGHQAGDNAIADTTLILRDCFGDRDVVGRLGGDEFAVLVPGVEAPEAESLKQKLNEAVATFNAKNEREYRLSISVGLCIYDPAQSTDIESLVETADKAMYDDKQRRRKARSSAG